MEKQKRVIRIAIGILIAMILLIGGKQYMDRKKVDDLYRHAFSLLEEQIATYVVEHYAGVSKIEFSPIYVKESNLYDSGSIKIVPVIHDEYGNHAFLGGDIPGQNISFSRFGTNNGIYALDFDSSGDHIIYLDVSKNGEEIDVSDAKELPEEARLSESADIDEIIDLLVEDKQLKDVYKQEGGSPSAEIVYNLEIIRGEVEDKWR